MTIKSRLAKLEEQRPEQTEGQILWRWEYPTDEAFEAAVAQHVIDYPHHKGVRGIDYGVDACIVRDWIAGNPMQDPNG